MSDFKIVLASDTHYGNYASLEGDGPYTNYEHEKLARRMHAEKPDALVVAGDCAESCMDLVNMKDFLRLYKNPHGASICIPGNHDMWLPNDSNMTAEQKYEWFFEQCAAEGWVALRDKPIMLGDGIWFAGNMCWYDFSTIDPEFAALGSGRDGPNFYERWRDWSDYAWMRKDKMHCKEKTPMLDFCKKRMEEFDSCLFGVPPRQERRYLCVLTHIVGFEKLQAWFRKPDEYRAYMGNSSIGKKVAAVEPDLYYCGHTHRRKEFKLGRTLCVNNGSGYGRGSKVADVVTIGEGGSSFRPLPPERPIVVETVDSPDSPNDGGDYFSKEEISEAQKTFETPKE